MEDKNTKDKVVSFSDGLRAYKIEKQVPIQFYTVPWAGLVNDYKLVKGEVTIFSGYSGNGKSDVVLHLGLNAVTQGANLFIASLELSQRELYDRLGQITTGIENITDEYWNEIDAAYGRKIKTYDEIGLPDFDALLNDSEFYAKEWGYDVFIYDNLMMMTEKEDDYNEQKKITKRLVKFAKSYNVCVLLVAHSKKPQSKLTINKNERAYYIPDQSDVKGCSSIAQLADNHLSVTINQEKLIALQKLRKKGDAASLTDTDQKLLTKGCSIVKRDKRRNSKNGEIFTEYLYYCKKFCRLYTYDSTHINNKCTCKPYVTYSNQE